MEPAGEDDARTGEQRRLDRAGAGPEMLGVDAAGHPDHPPRGDAQLEPLPLDLRRDRREGRVAEDDRARRTPDAARAAQLVGLAVVARAGRLHQGRLATQPSGEPGRSPRLPRAPGACGSRRSRARSRKERRDHAGHEARGRRAAAARRLDPAMDEDALVLLVVDRDNRARRG